MSRTITNHGTTELRLTHPADNPVFVAAGASIIIDPNLGAAAIYGSKAAPWSIANSGVLSGSTGISLAGNGTVTNHAGATISGHVNGSPGSISSQGNGITISGNGVVANNGTISGGGTAFNEHGGHGIAIAGNGAFTNGGVIYGAYVGISTGGYAAVSNDGTISGGSVAIEGGGRVAVTNHGTLNGGLYGVSSAGAGTVANSGVVIGENGSGIRFDDGGTVANGSSANNAASITALYGSGVEIRGLPGKVGNFGRITSTYSEGILLGCGGEVVNGSSLDASASIHGSFAGVSIYNAGAAGPAAATVINYGSIVGDRDGVYVGSTFGVDVSGGAATIVNSGTIAGEVGVAIGTAVPTATLTNTGDVIGRGGVAVTFASGNDVVAIGAGARFGGAVVASATGANTLHLLAGPMAGSLAGIGSQFQHL